MARTNWENLKNEYITTNISYRKLAEKYKINASQLTARAVKDKWHDKRTEFRKDLEKKAMATAKAKYTSAFARLLDATTRAVEVAATAFEDTEQFKRYIVTEGTGEGCSEVSEKTFEKVDTRAVKDLVGVIKDATGLLRDFYDIPTPKEREASQLARDRLELEQQKAGLKDDDDENQTGVIYMPAVIGDNDDGDDEE